MVKTGNNVIFLTFSIIIYVTIFLIKFMIYDPDMFILASFSEVIS